MGALGQCFTAGCPVSGNPGLWWWCYNKKSYDLERWNGVAGRLKRDGAHVYLWLIHVLMCGRNQHNIVIILLLKKKKMTNRRNQNDRSMVELPPPCGNHLGWNKCSFPLVSTRNWFKDPSGYQILRMLTSFIQWHLWVGSWYLQVPHLLLWRADVSSFMM